MFFYKIPAPNEALLVSGSKGEGGALFRVVTGKGKFVFPWKSKARFLSLDLRQAQINEPCVTSQGLTLTVQAIAVFKVGNDSQSIINAATRFLDQQDQVPQTIGRVLAGHLRSIIGNMTVEDIITNRTKLAQQVIAASSDEMETMGLKLDAFQIQEITDSAHYIEAISSPHISAVQRDARIAAAAADQSAAEKENQAKAAVAGFTKDSEVAQAQAQAAVEAARAETSQAGPLAQAVATQKVTEEQAVLAAKQAELREAQLQSEVQKPADAKAYEIRTLAQADKEANMARAEGLAGQNLESILANRMVDLMPEITKALASGLNGANLTVLNGAEGITDLFTQILSQGKAVFEAVRATTPKLVDSPTTPE
jgi:flotillin